MTTGPVTTATNERSFSALRYLETYLRFTTKEGVCVCVCVCVCVFTPPLPRNGGKARTAIQVHAVNLIEIRLRKKWQPISNQS